ncbi:RidA family protein [Enterococcus hulanensis]|uniref:RidA family protein n=1 Tax=Enterococcus hulanensis TaxID=2559929 RepID=UPI001A8C2611|nr:Rid family detoxifying hydrolase [Enterococcus hulanensis]MBO0455311.1 RidA family protein [Enterococcus hulanensis]
MKKLPKAIGPYSPYRKKGKFLVTSGQLPINPETNTIEATTVYDQVLQCLENIETILSIEGFKIEEVLKLTVYLTDLSKFSEVNQAFEEKLSADYPARTAIEISKLPMDALVEIEAIVLGD